MLGSRRGRGGGGGCALSLAVTTAVVVGLLGGLGREEGGDVMGELTRGWGEVSALWRGCGVGKVGWMTVGVYDDNRDVLRARLRSVYLRFFYELDD